MRLLSLEHIPLEGPAKILDWAQRRKVKVTRHLWSENPEPPPLDDVDALVIMGGTMSVGDEAKFPWLKTEKALIQSFIEQDKKILGICLGAQLVAECLGAKVYRAKFKEIGWFTLNLTPEAASMPLFKNWNDPFLAFQWHGETFDIPSGAVHLTTGTVVPNQGFLWKNRVLGLQFHLEVGFDEVAAWTKAWDAELKEGSTQPYIQRPYQLIAAPERFQESEKLLNVLLDRFFLNKK